LLTRSGRPRSAPRRLAVVGAAAVVLALLSAKGAAPASWGPAARAFTVGEKTLHLVDHTRSVRFPGHRRQARPIVTEVLYPVGAPTAHPDRPTATGTTTPFSAATPTGAATPTASGATPASGAASSTAPAYPLVVFGHGFNVTPATYAALLHDWVRAGYVVAAPVFPLGNHDAPGGANEADLINQPRDMSFAITQLLRASARASGVLSGLVNPHEVAVAGQSDGGSTALAVAYNRHFVDHRIRAAIILSGARIPGLGGYGFAGGPPALAVQGTADPLNAPTSTYHYFDLLGQPKFLLRLWGAGHLSPYTTNRTERTVVTRVTIAFLDRYLTRLPGAARRMSTAGNVRGIATLTR
jgi:dienelactone hydrolase